MSKPVQMVLGALLLAACGRSAALGPTIDSISPAAATNERDVVIRIHARDVAAAGLPRVFLDEIALPGVTAIGVDAVAATVPAATEPATRHVFLVMPDGSTSPVGMTFTVLASGDKVR